MSQNETSFIGLSCLYVQLPYINIIQEKILSCFRFKIWVSIRGKVKLTTFQVNPQSINLCEIKYYFCPRDKHKVHVKVWNNSIKWLETGNSYWQYESVQSKYFQAPKKSKMLEILNFFFLFFLFLLVSYENVLTCKYHANPVSLSNYKQMNFVDVQSFHSLCSIFTYYKLRENLRVIYVLFRLMMN